MVDVQGKVADGGEAHEEGEHASTADDEGLAATEVLDDVQTAEGCAEIDGTENNLSDETVAETSALEDGRSLVTLAQAPTQQRRGRRELT